MFIKKGENMMKQDFLFEIGTEELPPKALSTLAQAFCDQVVVDLKTHKLEHGSVRLFYAPRRIALLIEQLETKQAQQTIERRGPAVRAAYDLNGKPTKALQGFLNACEVPLSDIQTLKTDKGEWVVYRAKQAGKSAEAILPGICESALQKLPIPKMMRWGHHEFEFVRPVHWVLMLLGDQVIKANLFGKVAGNVTYGHRFYHPKAIVIKNPATYASQLKMTGKVIADPVERQSIIEAQITELAKKVKAKALVTPALLNEVKNIVEWPQALLCDFNQTLLAVPKEALISSMEDHQKAFALVDQQQQLLSHFIVVSNLPTTQTKAVIHGNEKVMAARLADARFFYEQDLKTPLSSHLSALNSITFQKQLGSIADKVRRMEKVAAKIATMLKIDPTPVLQAVSLSKCDLMTAMVMEFPELQGIMGRYYAEHDGVAKSVAQAIADHYKPRFSGDSLPSNDVGNIVAMADQLTTLVGIFGIGQQPTGTKDPYKLRRSAIGLLRILIEKGYPLDLKQLLTSTTATYEGVLTNEQAVDETFGYILERLRIWYRDQGMPHGVIEAVLAMESRDLHDVNLRIQAVEQFAKLPEAEALIAANKRVYNILSKNMGGAQLPELQHQLVTEPAEMALLQAIEGVADQCQATLAQTDYQGYLATLSTLREAIDTFFEAVIVMADDPVIQQNRLALLHALHQLLCRVADISYLAV